MFKSVNESWEERPVLFRPEFFYQILFYFSHYFYKPFVGAFSSFVGKAAFKQKQWLHFYIKQGNGIIIAYTLEF